MCDVDQRASVREPGARVRHGSHLKAKPATKPPSKAGGNEIAPSMKETKDQIAERIVESAPSTTNILGRDP